MMKKHSFTLVELLAVLVVMSILMSIAVPAFRSLTKGHAPDRAAREIMGRIAATRAYAISKRVDTALIFMGNENSNFPNDLQFSAYRSCEVVKTSTGYAFVRWIKNDTWTTLPEGIMIGLDYNFSAGALSGQTLRPVQTIGSITGTLTVAAIKNEAKNTTGSNSAAKTVASCAIDDIVDGGTTVDMTNAIIFHSSGLVENPCIIELREAVHDESSISPVSDDSRDHYYPLVVRKTGKCVYYPESVAFGESLTTD